MELKINSMTNFKKYFTPAEAKRTLPLVRKIVNDILLQSEKLKELNYLSGEAISDGAKIKFHAEKIDEYFNELEDLGCFYKDWNFTIGLVDFPSIINDEEAFLCWRSDESEILYYHSINEGYAGRKLIPKNLFEE